jgi:hypothetical protein
MAMGAHRPFVQQKQAGFPLPDAVADPTGFRKGLRQLAAKGAFPLLGSFFLPRQPNTEPVVATTVAEQGNIRRTFSGWRGLHLIEHPDDLFFIQWSIGVYCDHFGPGHFGLQNYLLLKSFVL